MNNSKRTFMLQIIAAGVALPLAKIAFAEDVNEKDPTAVSLGFVTDATKATNGKYKAGQHCGSCMFFGGKAGDAKGPCTLLAGKEVHATSWCSAYAAKPA